MVEAAPDTECDCNSNGIRDACEPDGDGDGLIDDCDNCPNDPNPEQEDFDTDGFGAACDCDDTNPNANPGTPEVCANGIDDDCDGGADCADADCVCGACCLPPIQSACGILLPDPDCVATTLADCNNLGGTHAGGGTECEQEVFVVHHTATQWSHEFVTVSTCPGSGRGG
ncbi:MAG: MopE-related protein, partial [Planctomycetota bacterium]